VKSVHFQKQIEGESMGMEAGHPRGPVSQPAMKKKTRKILFSSTFERRRRREW
jgi:hypothetical protein